MSIGEPRRDQDGRWLVPTRIEADNTIGFAWVPLTPDHPMYDEWRQYIQQQADRTWVDQLAP